MTARDIIPLALPFDLDLRLPGSKSVANRALVCAALAHGTSELRHATPCDDVARMTAGLAALGFSIEADGERVVVEGGVPTAGGAATIDCGDAGTTLRFLVSVAALVPGRWTLTGSARLRERPVAALCDAWRALGAHVTDSGGHAPVVIEGATTRGGRVDLGVTPSSQIVSSLLLAGASLAGGIDVAGEAPSSGYIELTQQVLADFGIECEAWSVRCQPREPRSLDIEGDWSAAAAFLALAALTQSRLSGSQLRAESAQPDRAFSEHLVALDRGDDVTLDLSETPDQTMNLCVVAARRRGLTRLTGLETLRDKECDRIAVSVREFAKAGVDIRALGDDLVVRGPATLRPARLDPEGDHRFVMAFALLGMLQPGIEIAAAGCVAKSWPAFFDELGRARRSPRCIALVGMRGAGKTTLAAEAARALRLEHRDTDAAFEAVHGDIAAFVEREGWPAFRRIEAGILREQLAPGRIVSVGGGAVETQAARAWLRERSLTVWLDTDPETLRARIAEHPSLTGVDPRAELDAVLERRRPLYADVADIRLAGRTDAAVLQSRLRPWA